MRKRMGRPPKQEKDRRDDYLRLRLTMAEAAKIRKAAKDAGLTISEYLRSVAIPKE
jgi:uncharacterized protein (DUF1778 family)